MDPNGILTLLRSKEAELRARGVVHAALFGSRARGDNRSDSDIDIMIDIAPGAIEDVYSYAGLKLFVSGLFDERVDVVDRNGLKPHVRPRATADALYAF